MPLDVGRGRVKDDRVGVGTLERDRRHLHHHLLTRLTDQRKRMPLDIAPRQRHRRMVPRVGLDVGRLLDQGPAAVALDVGRLLDRRPAAVALDIRRLLRDMGLSVMSVPPLERN